MLNRYRSSKGSIFYWGDCHGLLYYIFGGDFIGDDVDSGGGVVWQMMGYTCHYFSSS